MAELYTSTLKYFRLAIGEFLPRLKELYGATSDLESKEKLENMIEAYEDIASKIDKYHLNLEDPNRFYDGEIDEIEINITQPMIEELVKLSIRLLNEWKNQLNALKRKSYLTDKNKEKIYKLEHLIWPLEALTKEESYVLGKYAKMGPLEFPGEGNEAGVELKTVFTDIVPTIIFPEILIAKVPNDIAILCREFNFNFEHHNSHSCMLLLRRVLPLAIVRKFQKINREADVKKVDGEYHGTEILLGKVEAILKDRRVYREVKNYKSLLDGSQHSFSLNLDFTDTQGAGIAIRLLLDDMY